MMTISHQASQTIGTAAAGLTVGSGMAVWITSHATILTLSFVGAATLVTILSFVINSRLALREDARREEAHQQAMKARSGSEA